MLSCQPTQARPVLTHVLAMQNIVKDVIDADKVSKWMLSQLLPTLFAPPNIGDEITPLRMMLAMSQVREQDVELHIERGELVSRWTQLVESIRYREINAHDHVYYAQRLLVACSSCCREETLRQSSIRCVAEAK